MGIFSSASPFDADIDRVTDEKNTSDNWGLILDICDRASAHPKDALQSAVRRLNDRNPHVQLQTITLMDACVSNSGKTFHLEVSSREFETELRRLIVAASTHRRVKARLLSSLKKWAESEFSTDSQLSMIPGLYRRLQAEGLYTLYAEDTPAAAASGQAKPPAEALSRDPNVVSSQQEQDDIAKAIALSMKEAERSPRRTSVAFSSASATSSIYPSTSGPAAQPSQQLSAPPTAVTNGAAVVERKVRALYDFEAAEDNELTFKTGEIILVTEHSDPNWWFGSNHRGRGLFPSNFVTSDLNQPTEDEPQRKSVQFSEDVRVRTVEQGGAASSVVSPEPVVVDQARIGRLLHLLNEADPTGGRPDSDELLQLEEQCLAMGPLIDQELERIDRRHAQLTKTSSELVEALNLYHQLMRDTPPPPVTSYYQAPLPPPGTNGYGPAAAAGPYYGQPPPPGAPQGYGMPPGPGPYMTGPYLPPQGPYMGGPPQQQLGPGQMDPSFYTSPAPPPVGMTQSGPPHQQQQWMPYTAPGAGAESQAPHQ